MSKLKRKQSSRRRRFASHRVWLTMGTIAAYAAAGGTNKDALLFSQSNKSSAQDNGQAQLSVRRFDIPAGPLDTVLAQFEKDCGVTIQYAVPKEAISGFKSPGVTGLYSQQQALRHILVETGLDFTFAGQNAVSIGVKNSQSVEVTATSTDSVALGKIPTSLLDTPQSVTAIPRGLRGGRNYHLS